MLEASALATSLIATPLLMVAASQNTQFKLFVVYVAS